MDVVAFTQTVRRLGNEVSSEVERESVLGPTGHGRRSVGEPMLWLIQEIVDRRFSWLGEKTRKAMVKAIYRVLHDARFPY